MPTRVTPETVREVADAAAKNLALGGRHNTSQIARATGVPRRTVRDILADLGPEVEALKKSYHDEMLAAWHDTFFAAYDEVLSTQPTARERQALAITMGISTEKVQLLSGQPTALVANLHEVRVSMPDLVARLGQVARIIEAEMPGEAKTWANGERQDVQE